MPRDETPALRQMGQQIASAPNRGRRLDGAPDRLSPGALCAGLAGRTIGREVICLPTVDSTNNEVKRRAAAGAPEGLVVLADQQTGGRGRRGRSFLSPEGKGLYCSVLLRPRCALPQLLELTAWIAVAACNGVERACGVRPGIKWTNDLLLEGKKLCGILTELGLEGGSGQADYVVAGVGINISQTAEDFGPLAPQAVSLAQAMGGPPRRADLALALLAALDEMYAAFPQDKARWLEQYRADCLTTGREVRILSPQGERTAFAEAIASDFSLVVRWPDGRREAVNSGEVSVRGLFGYAEPPL